MPDKAALSHDVFLIEQLTPNLTWIRVRPFTLWAQQGYSVLATNLHGEIADTGTNGFYERNTRYLSRYVWQVNDTPLQPTVVQTVTHHTMMAYYRTKEASGIPQDALDIEVARMIGQGMHEDISLTYRGEQPLQFTLQLVLEADFADVMELTRGQRGQIGDISQVWNPENQTLHIAYHIEDLHHGLNVRFKNPVIPRWEQNRLTWNLTLAPGERWHMCVVIAPVFCGKTLEPLYTCYQLQPHTSQRDVGQARWMDTATRLVCANPTVQMAYDTAKSDLAMMRLWEEDTAEDAWIPAAGLPLYVGVFGRDILTTGWQAGLMGPEMMRGAVNTMRQYQATQFDDWRDEQPGKIIHEARLGPMSLLDRTPHRCYYGSTTSTPLFLIMLSELYHWTGDRRLLEQNREAMDHALDWIENHGDLDGDGFYEYRTLSSQGLKNQGWKDSDEGIVYADGRIVPNPIATCEEQGWVYDAKIRAAIMYTALHEFRRAEQLIKEAHQLKEQFNRQFWMPEENFYALALDPDKRQVTSITSNPGHCLATGIVDEHKAGPVIGRMLSPDLFSGWGIRTLSDRHPRYNPYTYHLGTMWPVENGTFCMGFVRYGYYQHANLLAKAIFDVSTHFEYNRLPEAISGHPRDEAHPIPSIYPQSNMPQAWSASATAIMIQAMLGLYPFAPFNVLLLDPHLPQWLEQLTLYHLRVGTSVVSLHFWRDTDGKTRHRVLEKQGNLKILPHFFNVHLFHHLLEMATNRLARI
jgi:glycogen debranching enzyme